MIARPFNDINITWAVNCLCIYVYVRSQGVVRMYMYNQATITDESLFIGGSLLLFGVRTSKMY